MIHRLHAGGPVAIVALAVVSVGVGVWLPGVAVLAAALGALGGLGAAAWFWGSDSRDVYCGDRGRCDRVQGDPFRW